jgi:enoyl-CoA hydratase
MLTTLTTLRAIPRTHLYVRAMSSAAEPLVITSRSPSNNVAILTLNRPKALNALSTPLFDKLNEELAKADEDDSVRAVVITGSEKAFAAGADIKEMKDKDCEFISSTLLPQYYTASVARILRRT